MKIFIEEQRFKKWFLLPLIALPFIGVLIPYILKKEAFPEMGSETFWGITITILILLTVVIFIVSIHLKTKIDEQGVHYQFFPIHFSEKFISWNEIDKCYLKKYNSIRDFGGYGYRIKPFGRNKGKAINVGGKHGIQLELKNGKRLLIGSQKPLDAEKVLETYKSKFTPNEK